MLKKVIIGLFISKAIADACNGTLSYSSSSCTAPNFIPDCTWLSSMSGSVCNSTFSENAYVNGDACHIVYNNGVCIYSNTSYDTLNTFCCNVENIPAVTFSASPSVSASSSARTSGTIHSSNTLQKSATVSATCAFRSYDSQTDFSSTQGQNGWYYGYYNGATFTQFTNYAISNTGSVGSVYSWNYNVNSNGIISGTMIMPNGAGSCNTPTAGNIAPVLRWYNPFGSCYQDVTVLLSINRASSYQGISVNFAMNGQSVYSNTVGGSLSVTNYFNGYGINSIELTISPYNNACDYGQTTYRVTIMPMGASNSVIASRSGSPTISISRSPLPTITSTASASATATTFYTGNWVDLGAFNYANANIQMISSLTISQCQLRCWLNPLCGLIVVTDPCNTIDMNSSDIYSVSCAQCWLKQTSGWTISADSVSRSIMFYDRVYPPTATSVNSITSTASSRATASVVTYSSWNMCSNTGTTITLPIIGSSAYLMTNAAGGSYVDNAVCNFYINGANNDQNFRITVNSFSTEICCDFLTVYNSVGTQVLRQSGTLAANTAFFLSGPSIRILFTTDGSVLSSGIFITVDLVYGTSSPTSSQVIVVPTFSSKNSDTISRTSSFSNAPLSSKTSTISSRVSYSASYSASSSSSVSYSASPLDSNSITPSSDSTAINSASLYNSPSASISYSDLTTQSMTLSDTAYVSALETYSNRPTPTYCPSPSAFNTMVQTGSKSSEYSLSNSASFYKTYSPSYTQSPSLSTGVSYSVSPTSSVSNLRPAGPPPALPANLSSLSLSALGVIFDSMAMYPPTLITDNLQKLGLAALSNSPSGEFGITTSAFSVKIKALPVTDTNVSIPLSVGKTDIMMPVISGSRATSAIQWTSDPFNSKVAPDSLVLSLNVLSSSGAVLEVKNSSNPIIISMNLNVASDDERFKPLPSYMAVCSNDKIYVKKDNGYFNAIDMVNRTGDRKWIVPCLLNDWRNINCTNKDDIIEYTCPPLVYTPKCQYWDSVKGSWSTEGCIPVFSNVSMLVCSCNHLTDFSSRIDAVAQGNKAIFDNAKNVYSLEGLIKYVQWYSIFGAIGLLTFLLGYFATVIDRKGTAAYVQELLKNKSINLFLVHNSDTPIYAYDSNSKYSKFLKLSKLEQKNNKNNTNVIIHHKPHHKIHHDAGTEKLGVCHRIFLQHSRLQFIFKYDPRLSRVFRLLFIFTLQFHSLFITALMYNFTYIGTPMQWYDTILLSLITVALNMPLVRFIVTMMNSFGILEFKAQFPLLFEEYQRRLEFERYALHYIFKNPEGDDNNSSDSGINNQTDFMDDDNEQDFFAIMCGYLCMRGTRTHNENLPSLEGLSHKEIMKVMVSIVKDPYPYYEQYSAFWQKMPCHTWQGGLFISGCCGWIAWCLNYLLLFAASHEKSVGESILTSYATSEITTVFLIQPLTILSTFAIYYLVKRFENHLPAWIKKFFIVKTHNDIPSIFYYSDPWNKHSKSLFTSEFAYSIFIDCASKASGSNVLSYAPISAVADVIDGSETTRLSEVTILYKRILGVWDDIKYGEKNVDLTIRKSTGSLFA